MKISVVIPAYNEESQIEGCLAAVRAEVRRSGADAEIVVVNNASTDRTGELARAALGVRVVDEPRKGLLYARQAGYEASSGELIANIDADTRMPEGWMSVVIEHFEAKEGLVALSGPYIYTDLHVWVRAAVKVFYAVGYFFYFIVHYLLNSGAMLQGGNYVVRRSALAAIGGYDTSIVFYGEDTDIAKRIAERGEVRWTWALPMHTSGRRLAAEGVVRMGLRYALNFVWVNFFGHPYTVRYTDIRPSAPKEQK